MTHKGCFEVSVARAVEKCFQTGGLAQVEAQGLGLGYGQYKGVGRRIDFLIVSHGGIPTGEVVRNKN